MAFDFSKLRGRIVEKFGSCARFAAAMGHSKVWLSSRLNNVVPWRAEEMREAAALLGIAPEEIPAYFLTPLF
jgi:hypothetical protein